jgi:FkbM family methyltransferase
MKTLPPETTLPNGLRIFYLRKNEVRILYEQTQDYFRYEFDIKEGDTIFDVGANIGLFALSIYQRYGKKVNVYAFEPISNVFEVLNANAQRFGPEGIRVFPCGLAQESKKVTFAYHPNATMLSTSHQKDLHELQIELTEAIFRNYDKMPPPICWLKKFPSFLRSYILNREFKKAFKFEQKSCFLRTISEIISEQNIQKIDLLKVDVEKSELDVILGIESNDWAKIKQVVIEIHDIEDRVNKISNLLNLHGLTSIKVDQEPTLKGSTIFSLYATRPKSK